MVLNHQIINHEEFKSDICNDVDRVFINRFRINLSPHKRQKH